MSCMLLCGYQHASAAMGFIAFANVYIMVLLGEF